jgi:glycosyltransferase involved in cell wall biosynthesis
MMRIVRPSVVLTNTSTFPHGALAARLEAIPHIWHVREFGPAAFGLRYYFGESPSIRFIDAMSTRVIYCSQALALRFDRQISPGKAQVIYNAVATPEHPVDAPHDRRPLRLLCLGRVDEGKGQEDAVRATAILVAQDVDVTLDIVGGARGPYAMKLADLAESSSASGRVRFLEFTDTPDEALARCDVFLMTSRSEAFGRVTIEAMRAGRPVVAGHAAGSVELIRDASTGLFYDVGNPIDLAERVLSLWQDPMLRHRIARAGQDWARQTFSLTRHGRELAQVIDGMVADDHRPALMGLASNGKPVMEQVRSRAGLKVRECSDAD